MKILLEAEPDGTFGRSFPLEAELSELTITELRLHAALERFGRQLAAQYRPGKTVPSGRRIIGVELHSINFSLVTAPEKS